VRGLLWSDGEPLTADDVAFTINTSRDQEWFNHSPSTANLEATAVDERTVEITTSVPDPKLPTMDVYILPEAHLGGPVADDITDYDALDGVGSGPFTLKEWNSGQSGRWSKNPNYWKGRDNGIDQRRVPRVLERRRDGGGAAEGRDRRSARLRRRGCSRC
jgi:peptide/nickel transport system substrate-binding protein